MSTTLYRLFDAAEELLYVGIASNPGRRFSEGHAKDKPWWGEVARCELEHFETREEAAAAEVAAIIDEHPRYNIVHNRTAEARVEHDRVVLICNGCHTPVEDGDGVLEVLTEDYVSKQQQAVAYERSKLEGAREEAHKLGRQNGWDEETTTRHMYMLANMWSFGELSEAYESPAKWCIWHFRCDPDPRANSYWIDVERFRTWPDVVHWCAHLSEKNWLEHTDWTTFLYGLLAASKAKVHP